MSLSKSKKGWHCPYDTLNIQVDGDWIQSGLTLTKKKCKEEHCDNCLHKKGCEGPRKVKITFEEVVR